MTAPSRAAGLGDVTALHALLDDIDRAGHLRGTASWLVWLRLKAAASRSSARTRGRALRALLGEIHRLGLIAGTDAHARWQLLKAGASGGDATMPAGRYPSCHDTFLFWRGRQMRRAARAASGDARSYGDSDGD